MIFQFMIVYSRPCYIREDIYKVATLPHFTLQLVIGVHDAVRPMLSM